ncbi:ABC transporter substrate-binding protein [Lentibacillus saliphilus]|uniref:ABC transporter substrate-binding protein n=1 Tax=Lentibacillus saliphilus TaxID=2737028 RepID=UPI001C3048CA|nr:ABC transporter substrate-binding protein [Lentibacillus saliphilus]
MRKWLISGIAIVSLLITAACGSDATYTVGATQILEHPSLDAAYEGFKAALEDAELDVEFDYQNAQNDQNNVNTISTNFVNDDVDLIFANSTPSALGALAATEKAEADIPILFTSVTDAVESDLVTAMDEPGDNITGVVDQHPDAIAKTIEFIDTYFSGATVGLVYNAGEQNSVSQINAIKEAGDGTSLSFEERTVGNSSEVQQATNSLVSDVDVFYIITDNTVVSALDSVVGVANDQDIPLIVAEPDSLKKGGFATFGIDYYTIGYRTGEMAVDILQGDKTTKDIPVEYPSGMELFINKEAAEAQGIEWNADWDDAKTVDSE